MERPKNPAFHYSGERLFMGRRDHSRFRALERALDPPDTNSRSRRVKRRVRVPTRFRRDRFDARCVYASAGKCSASKILEHNSTLSVLPWSHNADGE
jgi:hypothetical protein